MLASNPSIPRIKAPNVDRLRLQGLAPRKGEQALNQGFGALGGLQGAFDHALRPGVATALALEHVQAADDRHQQVVEVVSDAAGELAHGVHLLTLAQGILRLGQGSVPFQPLGHVIDELIGADLTALRVTQDVELHFVVAASPVGIAKGVDLGERFPAKSAAPNSFYALAGDAAGPRGVRAWNRPPSAGRQRCARTRWRSRG